MRWLGGDPPHKDVLVAEILGGYTPGDARLPAYQLVSWWRTEAVLGHLDPATAAASVARAVAVAAGNQLTFADVAGDYHADPAAVRAAAADVRRRLALSPELGW